MARPILFGDTSHIGVRCIAFALTEKGVAYGTSRRSEWTASREAASAKRLSLSGEPLLEHDGLVVGGVGTTLRFVDEALPGPLLQPTAPRQRARMNQALDLQLGEAVPILGGKVVGRWLAAAFMSELVDPLLPDSIAVPGRLCVARLEEALGTGPYFAGDMISLADIALAPIFAYLMPSPDAVALISPASQLRHWWARISKRESFQATDPNGSL